MGTESRKRSFQSNSNDGDDIPETKRTKTAKPSNARPQPPTGDKKQQEHTPAPKTDFNGDPYWEVSRMRRVTVSTFKGRTMVNVREYYEKDGAELPGKKGISMPLDQFNALIELLPGIEGAVRRRGGSLVRPEYGEGVCSQEGLDEDEEAGEDSEGSDDDDDEGGEVVEKKNRQEKKKKPSESKRTNIEATSDEDESG